MLERFDSTCLTPKAVAQKSGFLDWNSQPSRFKHYPDFCYRLSHEALGAFGYLLDLRFVSDTQSIGAKPYERLNVPSAGNLHPCELYLQLRGLEGIISGIYHVDAQRRHLVLIREIEREGLEPYVGLERRFVGVLALLTLVPFRSAWKYAARSTRYCYLDAGHQLAALLALLPDARLCGAGSVAALDAVMGFGADETSCCVVASGVLSERPCLKLEGALMRVAPTDYAEAFTPLSHTQLLQGTYNPAPLPMDLQHLRRSARRFSGAVIEMEWFMNVLETLPLHVSFVLWRAQGISSGIYRNGVMILEADCSSRISALLLEQRFIEDAAAVAVLHTSTPDEAAHLQAGMAAHALYLEAEARGLGCSGIGAYYDEALAAFLQTDESIVYVIAVGGIS